MVSVILDRLAVSSPRTQAAGLRPPASRRAPAVPASLVIQTSFLGDTVLTTPLIAELARRGPVDVVAGPGGAGMLTNNGDIRRLIMYDKRDADSGMGGLWRAARRIRQARGIGESCTAYLAQGSVRSAVLARLAGCAHSVGFDTSAGRWLYTRRVPYAADRHHAERLWRLACEMPADAPAPSDALRPRLYPGQSERHAVDALLGRSDDSRPLIGLAPGSVWATKRWPHYADLARRIASIARLAVIGGRDDAALAEEIVRAAGAADTVNAVGMLSLLGSAELIGRCALLVTNDSSPQHLASAMGTPTIAIFGPTVPAFGFGPLAPGSLTLGHENLDCRPCHHHGPPACPLGHWRCMKELDVSVVERAVHAALGARTA